MSNQLGNHKNVLGSSSQGWSIILVPALPGLPIHPFLAETLCLTIALSYKKKKKKALVMAKCSAQAHFPHECSSLTGAPWERMCVCVFAPFPTCNLPALCQRLTFVLIPPCLFTPGLSSLPLWGFPKKLLVFTNWKTGREGWERKWKAELPACFTHFPTLASVSWMTLWLIRLGVSMCWLWCLHTCVSSSPEDLRGAQKQYECAFSSFH